MIRKPERHPLSLDRQSMDAVYRIRGDRLAVADADDMGIEGGHSTDGRGVLLRVQVERRPTGTERRPGHDRIPCDQEATLRPEEREVSGRMAWRMEYLQRAQGVLSSSVSSTGQGSCLGRLKRSPS